MKYLIFCLSFIYCFNVAFAQTQKETTLIPVYKKISDQQRPFFIADTNAFKQGFIPWIMVPNPSLHPNKKKDTVWIQENGFDGNDWENWIYIGQAENKNKWYIYSEYASKENTIITTWIRLKTISTTENKKVYKNAIEKMLISVDCKTRMYKIIKNVLYDSNNKIVGSNSSYAEFEYPMPESLMETTVKEVCKRYN